MTQKQNEEKKAEIHNHYWDELVYIMSLIDLERDEIGREMTPTPPNNDIDYVS